MALSASAGVRDIPTYRIDLAVPPSQRYAEIVKDFIPQMQAMTVLFSEVLCDLIPWAPLRWLIERAAPFLLRSVYNSEEDAELKGMSKASGIPLHFFIALNVLLDSLLGCTTGGVLVTPSSKNGDSGDDRMMHFRSLDWAMDRLRSVLVVLEFVDSKATEPTKVIATSVSHVGLVGVLTGVRENLSLSFNFRASHRCSTLSLRIHQLLVVLGLRPSISAVLREVLLYPKYNDLGWATQKLSNTLTSPCYLVLCNRSQATVIEKDLYGQPETRIRTSESFIVQTNHDNPLNSSEAPEVQSTLPGMDTTVERMECLKTKWDELVRKSETKRAGTSRHVGDTRLAMKEETLTEWMSASPVMNQFTQFSCVLDPSMAKVRWLIRGDEQDKNDSDTNIRSL